MEYGATVITNAGTALMSKLLSGNKLTKFTKIVLSETKYSENQLANLTALSNIKATADATTAARNATNVETYATFNNEGNTASYTVNTIGVMAQDPDGGADILYSVTPAIIGGYVPTDNGVTKTALTFKVLNEVARASVVNMTTDPAGVATYLDLERMKKPYQAWANSADGKTDFTKINIKNLMSDSYDNGVTVKFLTDIYSDTTLGQAPLGAEVTQVNATIEVDGSTVDTGLALRCVFLDKDNAFINQSIGSFSANRFKGTLTFTAKKPANAVAVSFRLARNYELSNFSVFAKRFMVTTNNTSASIFLSGKKSDRYNAFMKYTGFSNKDSNDYRDYTWVRSDEAQAINYEAWANDKNGTNFSRYYPKPNLVGGNASAFKDWYPTAGTEAAKDNVATRLDGGILQQSGISATGTDAVNDYRQWQVSSVKSEGSDLLNVKANTMYTISFESRAVSQSWVGSSATIDFRANYKDGSTKIIGIAKVNLTKDWQVGTATFTLTQDDITNVDYFRIVVNHIGQGTVQFRRMKMEDNPRASMFIPNSRDTGVKAIDLVPAYRGISNAPSTDHLDYVWDKSEQYRDAELQQIKTAIIALGGTV